MDIFNIVALLGGTGLIGAILLAIFAPSVLSVAAEWLKAASPLVRGAAEAIVTFVKALWDGFKDMVDNVASIVFVVTCVVVTAFVVHHSAKPTDKQACVAEFRKEYRFVKRTPAEKKEYLKQTGQSPSVSDWFDDIFKF